MVGQRLFSTFPRLSGRTSVRMTPQALNKGRFAPTRGALNRRFFATPGRPKGAVGEASRPIKRTRSAAVKSTTKTTSKTTSKSKAKKPAAPKKKKTAAAAKKPARKPLTEKKKASLKKAADKLEKAVLREAALAPPIHVSRSNAWNELVAERLKGNRTKVGNPDTLADLSRQYKALSPAELEHYNHLAATRVSASLAAIDEFVKKHTPAEIVAANAARAKLQRFEVKDGKKASIQWRAIKDPRIPRPPVTAFTSFVTDRHASGDFKHIRVTDAGKLIATEWKALDASTKQRYLDSSTRARREYEASYEAVVGITPGSPKADLAAVAA